MDRGFLKVYFISPREFIVTKQQYFRTILTSKLSESP